MAARKRRKKNKILLPLILGSGAFAILYFLMEGSSSAQGQAPPIGISTVTKEGNDHYVTLTDGRKVKILFTSDDRPFIPDPNNSGQPVYIPLATHKKPGAK